MNLNDTRFVLIPFFIQFYITKTPNLQLPKIFHVSSDENYTILTTPTFAGWDYKLNLIKSLLGHVFPILTNSRLIKYNITVSLPDDTYLLLDFFIYLSQAFLFYINFLQPFDLPLTYSSSPKSISLRDGEIIPDKDHSTGFTYYMDITFKLPPSEFSVLSYYIFLTLKMVQKVYLEFDSIAKFFTHLDYSLPLYDLFLKWLTLLQIKGKVKQYFKNLFLFNYIGYTNDYILHPIKALINAWFKEADFVTTLFCDYWYENEKRLFEYYRKSK